MRSRLAAIAALFVVIALTVTACTPVAPTQAPPAATQVPATQEPAPTTATMPTYVIASDATFPPMEFVDENKNIVGFDIDLIKAIAEVQGFEVEIKNTAWDGIFAGLDNGDYDAIISSVTIREDRQATYDFSDAYFNAGQVIIVLVDNTEINGAADLSGKTVGAQIGTTGAFAVADLEGTVLKEYDTIDLAFLDLANGVIDAVVVDTPVAGDFVLTSQTFQGKFKIVGEPIADDFYGLLVKKGENADLIKSFNEGLAKIKADGTYDAIYAKWILGK